MLTGRSDSVSALAFSADGETLITGSGDRTLASLAAAGFERRLWSLDTGEIARHVCRVSAAHHWSQLLADAPCRPGPRRAR
ncbi:hypothetical protein GCM10009787_63450 [Streptomyces bangladeshensis]|uniref:Anaphase-promoting complex subunit 4 WD40 domain-containing protein n=1 Tax=Streptomyces bangladeshensis TaxID=295352 RepID=A0ABP5NTK8_9ACTN